MYGRKFAEKLQWLDDLWEKVTDKSSLLDKAPFLLSYRSEQALGIWWGESIH